MDSKKHLSPARGMDSSSHRRLSAALCIAVAVLFSASASAGAGEPARAPVDAVRPKLEPRYLLQYKFRPGQDIYYEATHSSQLTTQKGEHSETTQNESRTLKHLHVVSVDADGCAVLEAYLDRVRMWNRFGDSLPVEFNSELNTTPRGFGDIRDSIGRPLSRSTVERNGRLKKIISLAEKQSKAPSDDRARNFLYELPSEPITVGTEWTERMTTRVNVSKGLTQNVAIMRKFKLESVEKNLATISVRSVLLTPTDDGHILGQLIQKTPKGSFDFDMDAGLIVSRTMGTNKTELGVFGGNSSMKASSTLTETLIRGPVVAEKISLNTTPKAAATE